MAEKIKRWLIDDMEDSEVEADQTVQFGLDGTTYEIDLSSKNATRLRTDMQKYIDHARVLGRVKPEKPKAPPATMAVEQSKAARDWLRNNGYPNLSEKGRIPRDAMAFYNNQRQEGKLIEAIQ